MHLDPLDENERQKIIEAWKETQSYSRVSKQTGYARSTCSKYVKRAAAAGELGTAPVLPGFQLAKTTAVYDQSGNLIREFIQQKPESGGAFNVPQGHVIKGVSAYVDPHGGVKGQWIKTREGERPPEETAEIIRAAFEDFTPAAPRIAPPKDSDDDRLTAYIFCDWHVGLFAYGRETGGPDWDLSIARKVIADAVTEIVETSPPSSNAIILGLGDLLHADNGRNQTERSGNILDVDTRYSKCLETVCDLMAEATEQIVAKHRLVEMTFKPGNHDENSTTGIRQALRMYWRDNGRVSVDTSPDAFYWRRFGVNLIGGTHGDKAKIPELPLIMANRRKEDWAASTTRHLHTGHVHHDTLRETGGVHVFSHRAPVAQDAFHASHGYLGGRSIKSYTYHTEKGARGHSEVEIA